MKTTPIGHRAIRIAVRRGHVTYELGGVPDVVAATDAKWIRRDNRCHAPTFRPTREGRAWLTNWNATGTREVGQS